MEKPEAKYIDGVILFVGLPLGVIALLFRNVSDTTSWVLASFAGSYPSFIFIVGGLMFIRRVKGELKEKSLVTFVLGALCYEYSQQYVDGVYDHNDILAITVAALLMWLLIYRGYGKSE